MKVTNVRIFGMGGTGVAARYPMISKVPSEAEFVETELTIEEASQSLSEDFKSGKDYHRMCHLGGAKIGSGHSNFLKGIIVQFDCEAPRYWWNQLQRYNFVDFVSSQSQMHRIGKLNLETNKDLLEESIELAHRVVDMYNAKEITIDQCLANIPQGVEITARLSTNYLQLKTVYAQRRHHRSRHWQEFCDWVETLPLAQELIISEVK